MGPLKQLHQHASCYFFAAQTYLWAVVPWFSEILLSSRRLGLHRRELFVFTAPAPMRFLIPVRLYYHAGVFLGSLATPCFAAPGYVVRQSKLDRVEMNMSRLIDARFEPDLVAPFGCWMMLDLLLPGPMSQVPLAFLF